jgi:hypothetical protein
MLSMEQAVLIRQDYLNFNRLMLRFLLARTKPWHAKSTSSGLRLR